MVNFLSSSLPHDECQIVQQNQVLEKNIKMGACQSTDQKKPKNNRNPPSNANPQASNSIQHINLQTRDQTSAAPTDSSRPKEKHQDNSSQLKIAIATSEVVNQPQQQAKDELETKGQAKELLEYEKKNKRITLEDFILIYSIGEGAFAKVYLGYLKGNLNDWKKHTYAIKQMKKKLVKDKQLEQNLTLQKAILKQSQSPFITRLYCAFRDEQHYYLVMEWAQGGDLYTFIKPNSKRQVLFKQAGEPAIRFILACVILSLEHLHNRNIIYADLKPENVLLFEDGYAKLADFGLSHGKSDCAMSDRLVGTRMYFAPQMILEGKHTKEIDLWSLGVMAYELSNFFMPFDEDDMKEHNYRKVVNEGQSKRKWLNQSISLDLRDLINNLLRLEPKSRLGASSWSQLKDHPFFKSVDFDWQALKQKKLPSPLLQILKVALDYQKVGKIKPSPKMNSIMDKSSGPKRDTIDCWTENNSMLLIRP